MDQHQPVSYNLPFGLSLTGNAFAAVGVLAQGTPVGATGSLAAVCTLIVTCVTIYFKDRSERRQSRERRLLAEVESLRARTERNSIRIDKQDNRYAEFEADARQLAAVGFLSASGLQQALGEPRVLLLEDHLASGAALVNILNRRHFATRWVRTVAEARAEIESGPSSTYAILDLMLPDGGGEEIVALIRDKHMPCVPIVITGASDPERLERVRSMGALVIRKPLDLGDLWTALGEDDSREARP